jgi:hypothetical protein
MLKCHGHVGNFHYFGLALVLVSEVNVISKLNSLCEDVFVILKVR